jgi:hypothetical protein
MATKHQRKTFGSWYLFNLLGWAVGFSGGFILALFYWLSFAVTYPSSSIIYKLGDVGQLLFPLLGLIVCLGVAQWLKFRQWEVRVDVYKWIAANVKGTFFAVIIFIFLGAIVGQFQRPILDFLYGEDTQTAQTPFILSYISVMLPLLGSIGTSVMVAKDILNWESGKRNLHHKKE